MPPARQAITLIAALFVLAVVIPVGGSAQATFTDIGGNVHAPNIEAIAAAGVTAGCDATGTLYCPAEHVTRAQMATFLARALEIDVIGGSTESAVFSDADGVHAANIDAVAAAGITLGCDATGTLYCPNDPVNRAQMASFLARAFDLPPATGYGFTDVSGTHADNVSAIAAAGITLGCDADGTLYCPADAVRRDQMGSFLARAMGIAPLDHQLSLDPDGLSFGTHQVGAGPSAAQTLTIRNTGLQAIALTGAEITGNAPDDFTIVAGDAGAVLAPGASSDLEIVFEPSAWSPAGRTATLTVAATEAAPTSVTLSGTGAPPPNSAPVVTDPGEQLGDPGDPISLQIVASDPDGDPLTFNATGLPVGLAIDASGLISGTLTDSGTSSVVVTVSDGIAEDSAAFGWHVSGTAAPPSFDLSLDRFYLSQAVPALDSAEPAYARTDAVAGRAGLARAFVSAGDLNEVAPVVRLYWQNSEGSGTVMMAGPGEVPLSPSEGSLADTFTTMVDGSIVTPDLEIYIEVDPDDAISETDETNNRYPASGWLSLDAVVVPTMEITLVPITFQGVTPDLSDPESFLDDTLRMLPVADYDIEVRPTPYVVEGDTFDWNAALGAIATLRSTDGSSRMYHGIVDPAYSSGIAGIGYIGWPVAISWNRSSADGVVAHELGHNFNRTHAPCGVTDADPWYPYPGAWTGVWGYDMVDGTLKAPYSFRDFMSYCDPAWISDYSFQEMADFRSGPWGYAEVEEPVAGETTVVVGGTVDAGAVLLDPLYQLGVAAVPPVPGHYSLVGRAADGRVLFDVPFAAHQAEVWQHGSEPPARFGFGFTLPDEDLAALTRVDVIDSGSVIATRTATAAAAGSGSHLQQAAGGWAWDTDVYERALVLDPASGQVLAIDESGVIEVDRPVDVLLSDGLRSTTHRIGG